MKMKEVAEQLNVSPRTIPFYEEKGLIAPEKEAGNQYRIFSELEVERVRTVLALREIGMSIQEIKKAFAELDRGRHNKVLAFLEKQRVDITDQWVELRDILNTTDEMIKNLHVGKNLQQESLYQMAEGLKNLKNRRRNWADRWDFDDQAVRYDEEIYSSVEGFNVHSNYDEALDLSVEAVRPKVDESGLDIGIGTGNLAGRFLEAGANICGVDQSAEMLKQCRDKFPAIQTKLGHFLALPYEDGQFDFVVSSYALHHLEDDQKELALQEMGRVLNASGRICITDLMFEDSSDRQQYIQQLKSQERNDIILSIEDEYYADRSRLLSWLQSHGFHAKANRINAILHIIYAEKV